MFGCFSERPVTIGHGCRAMMKLGNDAEARGVLKILAPANVILTVPLDARGPKVPLPHSAFIGSPDHSVKHPQALCKDRLEVRKRKQYRTPSVLLRYLRDRPLSPLCTDLFVINLPEDGSGLLWQRLRERSFSFLPSSSILLPQLLLCNVVGTTRASVSQL